MIQFVENWQTVGMLWNFIYQGAETGWSRYARIERGLLNRFFSTLIGTSFFRLRFPLRPGASAPLR
jgi:hypothetical protein